jgi:trimethylamine-N-oxide reductase (cytochrome c)
MRWYAEDRHKDMQEPLPLPSQFTEEFGKGLETQSGKFEFVSSSLKRLSPQNPERPPLNSYIPAWEGPHAKELYENYPLQMVSSHPRYSFHTYGDAKDSTINDVSDHRVWIDGYFYWVMRINPRDAAARNIKQHDLIKAYNDRGAVIFVADISPLIAPGVVKTFESNADYDPVPDDGPHGFADRSGCANVITPTRPQQKETEGMAANSCLIEITKWAGPASGKRKKVA